MFAGKADQGTGLSGTGADAITRHEEVENQEGPRECGAPSALLSLMLPNPVSHASSRGPFKS